MSLPDKVELTAFFNRLCAAAAAETLPRFRSKINVLNKLADDFDPVTLADQEAERAIRELIQAGFPDHGIVGEEHGTINKDARYQWIIDPIDGTRAFISGLPVWGTLIALYEDGKPIAGVMDQPFTQERYLAVGGEASLIHNDHGPVGLSTSSVRDIDQACLMTTSPHLLTGADDQGYFQLEKSVRLFRYGCDCYAYCLLASGHIDLVVESGLNVYDIAALIPIIENAGGVITNWQGGPASEGGQVLAAANKTLHLEAMKRLA